MDLKLRGKTCLVTGASSGIGRATAILLAAEGARIVATARSLPALQTLAEEVCMAGGAEPFLLKVDLGQEGGPDQLAGQALAAAGRVDVLVNNAGGSRPMTAPDDGAVWAEGFRLNFEAPRRLAERLVPLMLDRGWGRVVNVTGAIVAKSFNAAGSAKAAMESWSKMAAGTYAARGRDGELRGAGAAEHGADPGAAAPDGGGPAGLYHAKHPSRAVRGRAGGCCRDADDGGELRHQAVGTGTNPYRSIVSRIFAGSGLPPASSAANSRK